MKETALDRMMTQTGRAEAILKVVTKYVENHGNVSPEDVNWSNVGDMAHVAELLEEIAQFIS